MSDLTDDLQNHLTDLKTFVDIEYANRLIERSLEALSPVLPDEVAELVKQLRNELLGYNAKTILNVEAADLLERQQGAAQHWKNQWDAACEDIEKLQKRIEELEAALKCFEHHAYRDISDQSFANDVIAELGGLPNERTPIAALQENE